MSPPDTGSASRITLLVPGLLRTPGAGAPPAELLQGLDLRALERFLTRADAAPREPAAPPAYEPALARLFDLPADSEVPVAAVSRVLDVGAGDPGWVLRADPVHLRAGLDKAVVFAAEGPFGLDLEEARALGIGLGPLWAEIGARFEQPCPQRWYLIFPEPKDLRCPPLTAVKGADASRCAPQGADARAFQRVLTEAQMVLHDSPVNAARARRGQPAINSVWLWGGGVLPPKVAGGWDGVWADDPFAGGLALLAGVPRAPLPADARAWLGAGIPGGAHLVLYEAPWNAFRYADLEGWREALQALSRDWLGPLLEALRAGRVAELTLRTEQGHRLHLTRRQDRRWWRRARPLVQWLTG